MLLQMYPTELEIKDTTERNTSASDWIYPRLLVVTVNMKRENLKDL